MSEKMNDLFYRARVVIDGAFYRAGLHYYSHGAKKGWINPFSLQNFLQDEVATYLDVAPKYVSLDVVYYDGQLVSSEKRTRGEVVLHEQLAEAGVRLQLFPLQKKRVNGQDRYFQKWVAEELICDTLSAAYENDFDILVLLSGDGKLVPLVRKVLGTKKPVIAAYFEIGEWKDSRGSVHQPTSISNLLLDVVTDEINLSENVDQEEDFFTKE